MNYLRRFIVCCLAGITVSLSCVSQYAGGASYPTIVTLRSDRPPKSAMITNSVATASSLPSPLLIAAAWNEQEEQRECRSLLAFDFTELPEPLLKNPRLLQSATLVLHPLHAVLQPADEEKPGRFVISRIKEAWNDSALAWEKQPPADSGYRVSQYLKARDRKHLVETDVTRMVAEMLRSGNNGFILSPATTDDSRIATSEVFASPWNENKRLRPLLVIKYRDMIAATPVVLRRSEAGGRQQEIRFQRVPGSAGTGQSTGQENQ